MTGAQAVEPGAARSRRPSVLPRIILVALLVLVLDLWTKLIVSSSMQLGQSIKIIPGLLNFTYIRNQGAAFGIGTQWPEWLRLPFFVGVFVIAAWVLYSFYRRCTPGQHWLKLSLGLVAGGALGNLFDRIAHRRVTDFIHVYAGDWFVWPYFNVADMAITVGVIMLFIEVWILEGRREGVEQHAASGEQQQPV